MWAIVYPPKLELETKEFLKCLQRVGPGMGFMLKAPKMVTMKDDRTGSYVQTLNKVINSSPVPKT